MGGDFGWGVALRRVMPMKRLRCYLAPIAVLAFFATLGYSAFGQTTRPTAPANCVVGVWGVPIRDMAKWKARGANTLVAYEPEKNAQGVPTVTLDQWTIAADAL